MKKIFRKNQIVITALAVMIAVAGYLNYAGKDDLTKKDLAVNETGITDVTEEDILTENGADPTVQEIGSLDLDLTKDVNSNGAEVGSEVASNESSGNPQNPGEAVLTSGQSVAEYIADVQLSREQIRAKNKDTLLEVINSENIAEAQKQDAINRMVSLTEIAEKENAAETLLKAKGFVNPVVSVTDGKVDVVISAAAISDAERAQVEDIVKRKTEISADNIIITLLNLATP